MLWDLLAYKNGVEQFPQGLSLLEITYEQSFILPMGEGKGKGIGDVKKGASPVASQPGSTEMLGKKLCFCKIQQIMPHYVQVCADVDPIFL